MREKGLVSIIVPVYNLADCIGDTLRSLLSQDYKDIEVIAVNDGSTDSTGTVIEQISATDCRLKLISQPNGGTAKARNTGLKAARGEYITFVDGDDRLEDGTISINVEHLNADPTADWVSFSIIRVDQRLRPVDNKKIYGTFKICENREVRGNELVDLFSDKQLSGVCCGAIYRADSIKNLTFPEGEYYEDSFFFSDLIVNTRKGLLSAQGAYLYVHREGSAQLAPLDKKRLTSRYRYILKHLNNLRTHYPEHEEYYQKLENDFFYFLKIEKSKKTEGARSLFKEYKKHIKGSFTPIFAKEIKYLIYTIVGYKNIVKILRNLKP